MRNADKVRKMTIDELADLFLDLKVFCPRYQDGKIFCDKLDCKPCVKAWLEKEE